MINFAQKRCRDAFENVKSNLNNMRGIVTESKLIEKRLEKLQTKKVTKIFNIIKVPHRKPFRKILPTTTTSSNGVYQNCQNHH